ncbi:MAG: hypothetical protein K2W96_04820 [Gemmataceae bacterium]|nr:hypothetical protein [Gemmataceae bacterium]
MPAAPEPTVFGQAFVFLAALVGPEPNPTQYVPMSRKLGALVVYASTGDNKECWKAVGAVAAKRRESEHSLVLSQKAAAELEAGIAKLLPYAMRPGASGLMYQREIRTHQESLETSNWQSARLTKLIAGRKKEERALEQAMDFVKGCRVLARRFGVSKP